MFTERTKNPLSLCLLLYFTCFAVRMWEFLALRTDQSALSENIVHKIFVCTFDITGITYADRLDDGQIRKFAQEGHVGIALSALELYDVKHLVES